MKRILEGVAALALVFGSVAAQAQNLVVNGDFNQVTDSKGRQVSGNDNYYINSQGNVYWAYDLTGWTNKNYYGTVYGSGLGDSTANFPLLDPNSDHTSGCGSPGAYRVCNLTMAGANSGYPQTIVPPASPAGGNYYGAIGGDIYSGTLTQTVTGLVAGQAYTLSFWSAAGVPLSGVYNYGTTSGGWTVTLTGSKTDVNSTTKTGSFAANGFSPWVQTIINFTASSSSEVLSFLPLGSPPMDLLDGVAILPGTNAVPAIPEPAEWALMGVGLLLIGARLRHRRTP